MTRRRALGALALAAAAPGLAACSSSSTKSMTLWYWTNSISEKVLDQAPGSSISSSTAPGMSSTCTWTGSGSRGSPPGPPDRFPDGHGTGRALAFLGIFTFIGAWNDFVWPLVVLTDPSRYTLQVALSELNGLYVSDYSVIMAGTLLAVLPLLVVFLLGARQFIRNLAAGSIKS